MTADAVGGVFPYAVSLARDAAARNVSVALALMGPAPSADQRAELAACDGLAVYESTFALEWMDDPFQDVDRAGEWLLQVASEFRPDVVHSNGYSQGALPFGVPKLVVAHSCVRSWWRAVFSEPAPERYAEYTRRVRAGLAGADTVIAPTAAMLDALRFEYDFETPAHVIPNGVDASRFSARAKQPYYFAAGRLWDRAKNTALLARIAPSLPWPVRVAGASSEAGDSAENLDLLGPLPRAAVVDWMARAPVFLHPAKYEPFGLAVLEAALSGCALVLGDIPSLREVWGPAALYVSPDDDDGWIRVARSLANDPPLRERLALRAGQRARTYGSRACSEAYVRTYRALARTRSVAELRSPFDRLERELRVESVS
jgi:glycosyltransferase involved in cell wall biosynthesis